MTEHVPETAKWAVKKGGETESSKTNGILKIHDTVTKKEGKGNLCKHSYGFPEVQPANYAC